MIPDFINFGNLEFLDQFYEQYTLDPYSIPSSYRYFFEGMNLTPPQKSAHETQIFLLREAYRKSGHLLAHINPIALPHTQLDLLKIENFGFSQSDLKKVFSTLGILPQEKATLDEIIAQLHHIYCGTVGVEYCFSEHEEMEKWLQQAIESDQLHPKFSSEEKQDILKLLTQATIFETFLHTKYVGQKRFSLEGGETLIPLVQRIIDKGSEAGGEEFVIGMSHRGRLNVLTNILKKSCAQVFSEFEDYYDPASMMASGDVKYHKGYSANIETRQGKVIHLALPANPSHLESIDPVLEGKVLAKQKMRGDHEKKRVIPLLIHGDAAFAGQGVVYETLQMSRLKGYATGGTIHIIINNQIGFTTLPKDSRSTRYASDLAKAFSAPVFHINAEDPEGSIAAIDLAVKIRQQFGSDVFIDMNCYRKYGHNEGDEPFFTQPLEYEFIRKKLTIKEIYENKLIQEGSINRDMAVKLEEGLHKLLHDDLEKSRIKREPLSENAFTGIWEKFKEGLDADIFENIETSVPGEELKKLSRKCCHLPADFNIHPKVKKLFQERLDTITQERPLDWATSEYICFASLLQEKIPIRLSGQDSRRGTFSQRHAVIIDQKSGKDYYPLQHIKEDQGSFEVYDSPLSEYASLAFEFGYSLSYPSSLVLWEAQFGDFANGAQIVMDQYISSSEEKWQRHSGLTMLLPHGYEGQGPEHSSGRMERYLQLAANRNIQIAYPTTPAQYFHLLRRQVCRLIRKPLIIFTPKSLLRHPLCVSPFHSFTTGTFSEFIDDEKVDKQKVERIIFCTGKVYYTLIEERHRRQDEKIAIIRCEQLFPFHKNLIANILKRYQDIKSYLWVQEEPKNMGAWQFINPYLRDILPKEALIHYVGRSARAAPAGGSHSTSLNEEKIILQLAFEEI